MAEIGKDYVMQIGQMAEMHNDFELPIASS
jgi:hypothetical protein